MKTLALTLMGLLGVIPLLTALHMVAASHFNPQWLSKLGDATDHPDEPRSSRIGAWTYHILAIIGFGTMGFAGTYAVLWWLPPGVGFHDEDGAFFTVRSLLSGMTGLWLAFHLPSLIARFASK